MNVTLQKSEAYTTEPGRWWTYERDGRKCVVVTCQHPHAYPAMIKGHADASRDWKIDAAGNVTPSIWIKGDCDWHVFAKLAGWTP